MDGDHLFVNRRGILAAGLAGMVAGAGLATSVTSAAGAAAGGGVQATGVIGSDTPAADVVVAFAETILSTWPNAKVVTGEGFEYTNGMLLHALGQAYLQTRDARYLSYVRTFFDQYVDARGNVTFPSASKNLDYVQPGGVLVFLHAQTGDDRYRKAAATVYARLLTQPRNAHGGFWHKQSYKNQMWADGIYMGDRFAALYGSTYALPSAVDLATGQALLFAEHAQLGNGLVRHAWDDTAAASWADHGTGLAPIVWSRAVGWFAMAVADTIAVLPAGHSQRAALVNVMTKLAQGLAVSQDAATGCWYQIVDQPTASGNYRESSGTGFFVYALLTAIRGGFLDAKYRSVALAGWKGLLGNVTTSAAGRAVIANVGPPQSVGANASAYTSPARRSNSPHGVMAAVLAAAAVAKAG